MPNYASIKPCVEGESTCHLTPISAYLRIPCIPGIFLLFCFFRVLRYWAFETADELSFCAVKPQRSYPSVKWNPKWTFFPCTETTDELSFCVVKLQMSYPFVLYGKTAEELAFCVEKLQMSTFCFLLEQDAGKNTLFCIALINKLFSLFKHFYSSSIRTVLDVLVLFGYLSEI